MRKHSQLAVRRRRAAVGAVVSALLCILTIPAFADASITRVVAPGAVRKATPCVAATPCEYIWAVQSSGYLDVVQFKSGEYDFNGSGNTNLTVPTGVTLEQAPGDATRPLIKQTVAFPKCNCAMISLNGEDVVRDLELDQAAAGPSTGAGALSMPPSSLVERSILKGVKNAMYVFIGGASTGGLRDDLVLAENGYAIWAFEGVTLNVDSVTAIAHGSEPTQGAAILVGSSTTHPGTINATNSIARGHAYDVEANAVSGGSATVNLHYSDARSAMEAVKGAGGKVNDTDHPMHGEPTFVSATDFHEAAGSPTIDAGTVDAASGALDLDGSTRSAGAAEDIGAYELKPAAPVNTEGTGTPLPVSGPLGPAKSPPLDGLLRFGPSHFRAAKSGRTVSAARSAVGSILSWSDSQAASTTFDVLALAAGVRIGHACTAPPRRRGHGHRYKACSRYVTVGSFTHVDSAGTNRLRFSGRIHGHRLAPRTYRLTATPRNSAGEAGAAVSVRFTIVR